MKQATHNSKLMQFPKSLSIKIQIHKQLSVGYILRFRGIPDPNKKCKTINVSTILVNKSTIFSYRAPLVRKSL